MKKHFLLVILFNQFFISFIVAQSVEVQGQLKINKTEKSITNDSVLVKRTDGSVGVKDAYKIDTGCSLKIGDSYEGGIIFHLDGSSCHGLIISTSDQANTTFGGFLTEVNTKLDYLYAGNINTNRIINAGVIGAASTCYNYEGFGFNDWYLPSLIELAVAYNNLYYDGVNTSFTQSIYWSSTEQDGGNAGGVNFDNGNIIPNLGKNVTYYVRCVRSF